MAKLLVVDDEANIRTLIKKYAQYEGYEIIEAVNGIDAVAKCRAEDYLIPFVLSVFFYKSANVRLIIDDEKFATFFHLLEKVNTQM